MLGLIVTFGVLVDGQLANHECLFELPGHRAGGQLTANSLTLFEDCDSYTYQINVPRGTHIKLELRHRHTTSPPDGEFGLNKAECVPGLIVSDLIPPFGPATRLRQCLSSSDPEETAVVYSHSRQVMLKFLWTRLVPTELHVRYWFLDAADCLFRCSNGLCLNSSAQLCDGHSDCPDSVDEASCTVSDEGRAFSSSDIQQQSVGWSRSRLIVIAALAAILVVALVSLCVYATGKRTGMFSPPCAATSNIAGHTDTFEGHKLSNCFQREQKEASEFCPATVRFPDDRLVSRSGPAEAAAELQRGYKTGQVISVPNRCVADIQQPPPSECLKAEESDCKTPHDCKPHSLWRSVKEHWTVSTCYSQKTSRELSDSLDPLLPASNLHYSPGACDQSALTHWQSSVK